MSSYYSSINCCYYHHPEEFLRVVKKSIVFTTCEDPSFHNHFILTNFTYYGTKQSFQIACGNSTCDQVLKSYGLHTMEAILEALSRLFDEIEFMKVSSVLITHYHHILLKLHNKKNEKSTFVACLDIADLIDNIKCSSICPYKEEESKNQDMKSTTTTTITSNHSSFLFSMLQKKKNDENGNTTITNSSIIQFLCILSFIGIAYISSR